MSNSSLSGACPPPFLQESLFPNEGYVLGRYCATVPGVADGQACCLPCPVADLFYPDNFYDLTRIAGYINVVALALCIFMLVSFVFLPADTTRRHYLNVCFIFSIIILQLGFIIPWAEQPDQCYNEITPNDQNTSGVCAIGGAFVICGGAAVNMWILIRAMSMHLQICWGIEPGKRFFWAAQAGGWLLTIALLATELSISGVSFRFGDYCHVNHENSLATFWIPLLVLAGISLLFQLSTFAYCLNVYIKHSFSMFKPSTVSSHADSTVTSFRSANARAVFRRVRKVVLLQWRGLAIAVIVVADVIFFALVYTTMDKQTNDSTRDPRALLPWLECLAIKQDHNQCLSLARPLAVNENLLIAVLMMLAVVGVQAFLLLCRWQMITGWFLLCHRKLKKSREMNEFVSLDARRISTRRSHIELGNLPSPNGHQPHSSGSPLLMSPTSPMSPTKLVTPLTRIENTNYFDEEHYNKEVLEKAYHSPSATSTNFSRPRQVVSPRFSDGTFTSEDPSTYSRLSRPDMQRQPTLPELEPHHAR